MNPLTRCTYTAHTGGMDAICAYCLRSADHMVGIFTVCDYTDCEAEAKRDLAEPTPLADLLARYKR